jgi:holo-[acyl-carrier protein] synthase
VILGIGIDLLNLYRLLSVYERFGDKFVKRILSVEEMDFFKLKQKKDIVSFLAKRFCVKESFLKAVGVGLGRGINLNEITLITNELGKPIIKLNECVYSFLEEYYKIQREFIQINISLTDEKPFINSFVVISKNI